MSNKLLKMKKSKEDISKLKELAEKLHNTSVLRKPIVIEFCGSPKSGKSTCIEAVKNVLRDCNYNVHVIYEKAKLCPISNKFDPTFNFWTVTTTINELMVKLDENFSYSAPEKIDVILIDRGILDSLIWFKWLESSDTISEEQYSSLCSMILMDRIRRSIDKTFIFKSDSKLSLAREPGSAFTKNDSVIMNRPVLDEFNKALVDTINFHGKKFNHEIIDINDNNSSEDDGWDSQVETIISKVLHFVIQQYMEQVAYIEKNKLEIPKHSCILDYKTFFKDSQELKFKNRNEVEDDDDCVQFIPIATIIDDDSILRVKKTRKSLNDSSQVLAPTEKNKDLFYIGGHIRKEDSNHNETDMLKVMRNALHRELKEEINLELNIPDKEPVIIYSNEDSKSRHHIACCWIVKIGPQKTSIRTNGVELIKNSSNNGFIKFSEINKNLKLENWSRLILTELLKDTIPSEILESINQNWEQASLF